MFPDFKYEKIYWDQGFDVIGIDEVGRGAFAGPVVVGGVVFARNKEGKLKDLGINDSKKLTSKKREYLSAKIKELAEGFYLSFNDVRIINNVGIGKATFLGMKEVAENVAEKLIKPFLLIDAFEIPGVSYSQKGIIRGDSLSVSIAAASVIAKVARDLLMVELSKEFPAYEFEKNKGYGTKIHREKIVLNGLSDVHRMDFCKNTLSSLRRL